MDFSGFPECTNGDVLVVLADGNRFQLHAEILKRHSKYFKERITQQNAATLSSGAQKAGETVRWRFDLLDKPDLDGEGAGRLSAIVSMTRIERDFFNILYRDAYAPSLGPRLFREATRPPTFGLSRLLRSFFSPSLLNLHESPIFFLLTTFRHRRTQ